MSSTFKNKELIVVYRYKRLTTSHLLVTEGQNGQKGQVKCFS